ncbi:MAG: exodeoxyribonuclease III [Acidimicrobiales bacterium]
MRIVTWNVNSLNARMPRVEEWLADVQPDVVCLQETKMADGSFPAMAFEALGYESVHHGDGRWNGVAILSRVGLADPIAGFCDGIEPDSDTRLVSATCGPVRVTSVYVPNGRAVDDPHYQYKLSWLARLREHLEHTCDPDGHVAVCGDFNIAPEDIDVWDIGAFDGSTHVTAPERDALAEVREWGLVDTFRRRYPGVEGVYSYWDYTAGRFHKRQGMRIDYVLASESLAATSTLDVVDRNARKGTKPSDHAPVIAEFAVEVSDV